jgi:predicted nucleic acid-binding protein
VKVFLDTNVLIDVLAQREPFYADAASIWTMAEEGRINGLIAAISVTNIYYIVRKIKDHRAAMKALILLRDTFTIAACDQQVIIQAMDSRLSDFEDAVQYFTAVHAAADSIVTRNPDHFPKEGCPVVSPAEFLAALEGPSP